MPSGASLSRTSPNRAGPGYPLSAGYPGSCLCLCSAARCLHSSNCPIPGSLQIPLPICPPFHSNPVGHILLSAAFPAVSSVVSLNAVKPPLFLIHPLVRLFQLLFDAARFRPPGNSHGTPDAYLLHFPQNSTDSRLECSFFQGVIHHNKLISACAARFFSNMLHSCSAARQRN